MLFATLLVLCAAPQLRDDTSLVAADEVSTLQERPASTESVFSAIDPALGSTAPAPLSIYTVGKRLQLLDPSNAPVGLSVSSHFHTYGFENGGPEVDFKALISRDFGPMTVLGSTLIARSVGLRPDVDYEAAIAVAAAVTPWASIAWETHLRGELVDQLKTDEDYGRPVGLTSGVSARVKWGAVLFQVLAGWQSPRGMVSPGPIVLTTVSTQPF